MKLSNITRIPYCVDPFNYLNNPIIEYIDKCNKIIGVNIEYITMSSILPDNRTLKDHIDTDVFFKDKGSQFTLYGLIPIYLMYKFPDKYKIFTHISTMYGGNFNRLNLNYTCIGDCSINSKKVKHYSFYLINRIDFNVAPLYRRLKNISGLGSSLPVYLNNYISRYNKWSTSGDNPVIPVSRTISLYLLYHLKEIIVYDYHVTLRSIDTNTLYLIRGTIRDNTILEHSISTNILYIDNTFNLTKLQNYYRKYDVPIKLITRNKEDING